MTTTAIDKLIELADRKPEYAIVGEVDLGCCGLTRRSQFFLRALFAPERVDIDGHVRGNDLNGFEARMGWSLHR